MKIAAVISALLLLALPAAAQHRTPAFAAVDAAVLESGLPAGLGEAVHEPFRGTSARLQGISPHSAPSANALAGGAAPDRWRSARRGAKVGAAIGAVAGVVGFAVIMHDINRDADRNRTPCAPGEACGRPGGMNVARAFVPVAYLIFAGVGAVSGALVGAGVGAATGI
jgi:hypothetical protein